MTGERTERNIAQERKEKAESSSSLPEKRLRENLFALVVLCFYFAPPNTAFHVCNLNIGTDLSIANTHTQTSLSPTHPILSGHQKFLEQIVHQQSH